MRRLFTGLALVFVIGARPAFAQVPGLPIYNAGVPRGIGVAADLGFSNEEAGKGVAFGVSGHAGFGPLGVTATLSNFNPDGPEGGDAAVGGTVNYKLFGGPLVPLAITLQGGVGYHKADLVGTEVTQWRYPVGVGFALTIPNPIVAIKPWLAPRLDIARREVTGTTIEGDPFEETSTETEFAMSAGLELNFLSGFGVHAAYDFITGGGPGTPGVFGIGAHYAFRIPGL
jgi:hypothetical protein